jgi:hypothetical protein
MEELDNINNNYEKRLKQLERKFKKLSKQINSKDDENPKPKRENPYITFCNEMRPILKQQHPDVSQTELMKLLATEWKKTKS